MRRQFTSCMLQNLKKEMKITNEPTLDVHLNAEKKCFPPAFSYLSFHRTVTQAVPSSSPLQIFQLPPPIMVLNKCPACRIWSDTLGRVPYCQAMTLVVPGPVCWRTTCTYNPYTTSVGRNTVSSHRAVPLRRA